MKSYLVMIKCYNCGTSNTIEQEQEQCLPATVKCRYCKCLTHTHLILGYPADESEARKEMAEAVG